MKLKLFDILGGPFCKRCGFDDIRALDREHIHGGGSKEKKNSKISIIVTNIMLNIRNLQKKDCEYFVQIAIN